MLYIFIYSGYLAAWPTTLVAQDLEQVEFVSPSIGVVVSYCKIYDVGASVGTKLLDFVDFEGETAGQISAGFVAVIQKFNLENKVMALSADNTDTNFGAMNRMGRVNVHTCPAATGD